MREKLRKPIYKKNCSFCKESKVPTYKRAEELAQFLSERGKILSRARSGNCALHQRRLVREIKRARYLGLLPYIVQAH
jgi:small subunit ribosomal protein S18